jgi:VanZ family protein
MTNRKLFYWLPVVLWAWMIFFLSSYSNPYQALIPMNIYEGRNISLLNLTIQTEIVGEVSHLFIYFVLGGLILRALIPSSHPSTVWYAWGIAILYSLGDEIHQIFVPGREFQLEDLAVDTIGALVGVLIYKWIASRERVGVIHH